MIEFGLYSFAEIDPTSDKAITGKQRIDQLLEEIKLADQLGLDIYAVGEHHRPDYIASAPTVILGAAAVQTKNIHLSTAVTVLSSDDPVRVYQQFATIDLLSNGRAEIMAGRGSFIESFPLFGFDLEKYDALFSEKLDLLIKLNQSEKVSWKGKLRPSFHDLGIYPRPVQSMIPIWIAAGGTPASAMRAGALGLPLALAIIGGRSDQFADFIELYRHSWQKRDGGTDKPKVGINMHAFIAKDSQQAADLYYPSYHQTMSRIGRERGWGPTTRAQFEAQRSLAGALLVGSPQQIIDKIMYIYHVFKMDRFLLQMSVGPMHHKDIMQSIELYGNDIIPSVRKMIGSD